MGKKVGAYSAVPRRVKDNLRYRTPDTHFPAVLCLRTLWH